VIPQGGQPGKASHSDLSYAKDGNSGPADSSHDSGDALSAPMSQKLSLYSQTTAEQQQSLHRCPFQQLVSLEELQSSDLKKWAASFAALLVKHGGPPDGVSVEEVKGFNMCIFFFAFCEPLQRVYLNSTSLNRTRVFACMH
jgi:hypothetical protein